MFCFVFYQKHLQVHIFLPITLLEYVWENKKTDEENKGELSKNYQSWRTTHLQDCWSQPPPDADCLTGNRLIRKILEIPQTRILKPILKLKRKSANYYGLSGKWKGARTAEWSTITSLMLSRLVNNESHHKHQERKPLPNLQTTNQHLIHTTPHNKSRINPSLLTSYKLHFNDQPSPVHLILALLPSSDLYAHSLMSCTFACTVDSEERERSSIG